MVGLLRTVWSWYPVAGVKLAEGFASPTGLTRNTLSPCFTRAEVQGASFGREIDCARCDGHMEAPRYPLSWAAADRDCWPTSPDFRTRVHGSAGSAAGTLWEGGEAWFPCLSALSSPTQG